MIDIQSKITLIQKRIKHAYALLTRCHLCPRECGVNRLKGETGFCKAGFHPMVSSDNLHFGEEPPISGNQGSGTIFFTGCNLGCVFCQNYPISHFGHGNKVNLPKLAAMMLRLQKAGAHNINLVTPTHFAPQIMGALLIAYKKGLSVPLVYNCGGYEALDMLRLWNGIVDIYMPDMKYSDSATSQKYSSAPDYPENNQKAVKEMFRQVGDLQIDEQGVANSGLLIRHLVLPENISGTGNILNFITEQISKNTYISLMSQYFPAYKALSMPPLNRRITHKEYAKTKEYLTFYGLERGWIQG
ncbi:radical SAM protein [bacterium]|nr:radical SAM protein [bacterium]